MTITSNASGFLADDRFEFGREKKVFATWQSKHLNKLVNPEFATLFSTLLPFTLSLFLSLSFAALSPFFFRHSLVYFQAAKSFLLDKVSGERKHRVRPGV